MLCSKLGEGSRLKWSDAFSADVILQVEVAKVFGKLMKKRERILETEDSSNGLPGASFLDPSSRRRQLGGTAMH